MMVISRKKKTFEELKECLYKNHPDIDIIKGCYKNYDSKFILLHNKCGYNWEVRASSIFRGSGCPKCGNAIRKNPDDFKRELYALNKNIKVIGEYKNSKTPIKVQCLLDNYVWEPCPCDLLQGKGCPVCGGRQVMINVNDFNSRCPHLIKYLENKEDGYKYTYGSSKKVSCKCPDCGYIKPITLDNLRSQGFSCDRCSDGVSYPNKFIRELLRQLIGNDYICEYHTSWSQSYKYDCYFEYNNNKYIIEMDGGFHYIEKTMTQKTLSQQKAIDTEKDKLAYQNGINIIRIDSRKSTLQYLKNNILKSCLADIFDLSNINWESCHEKGLSNLAKEVCEYFEANKLIVDKREIMDKFKISNQTYQKYIREGLKYGWCTFTEREKYLYNAITNKYTTSKPIQVYKDGDLLYNYPSVNCCARDLSNITDQKFYGAYMSKCAKTGRLYNGYLFKYI